MGEVVDDGQIRIGAEQCAELRIGEGQHAFAGFRQRGDDGDRLALLRRDGDGVGRGALGSVVPERNPESLRRLAGADRVERENAAHGFRIKADLSEGKMRFRSIRALHEEGASRRVQRAAVDGRREPGMVQAARHGRVERRQPEMERGGRVVFAEQPERRAVFPVFADYGIIHAVAGEFDPGVRAVVMEFCAGEFASRQRVAQHERVFGGEFGPPPDGGDILVRIKGVAENRFVTAQRRVAADGGGKRSHRAQNEVSHPDAAGMVLLAAAQKIRTVRERFGRLETPGDMPPDGRGLPQLFAPERQLDERRADRPLPEFQLRAEFEVERVPAARPESAGPQPCFAFAVAAAGEQQFGHAVRHGLLRRVPFIAAGELPVGGAGQRGGSHAEHSQAVPQQAVVDRKIHGFILLVVSG